MAVPQEDRPSPVIPIIILFILGTMLTLPSLTYDPSYWDSTIAEVQTHFVMGAFLIPVCLLLLVNAFGIPQVNPTGPRTPSSPFMESITQNLATSILLVVVIIALLVLIPLRNSLQSPWEPPAYGYGARNGRW